MHQEIVCQGRSINTVELTWLQGLIKDHQQWSRHRIALKLCHEWQWKTASGCQKTFAARSFLLKLEQRGFIVLPLVRKNMRRLSWEKSFEKRINYVSEPIKGDLSEVLPLTITICSSGSDEESIVRSYLAAHHYLGFRKTVGENLYYLIQDNHGRDLSCLAFGAAAWSCEARDRWIGWNNHTRSQRLEKMVNNTRFLILPWIHIPHLASHILACVLGRISRDWYTKYHHLIYLVETFVEKDRFQGTCYKAANFVYVGTTKGRSRQDRYTTLSVPIKDVYLYPLDRSFRERLC